MQHTDNPAVAGADFGRPVKETSFEGIVEDEPEQGVKTKIKDAELATDGGIFSNCMSKLGGQTNVNGTEFWLQWSSAGGDADRYVKESMPNYAITAGLIITMTFPYALETPDHILEHSAELAHAFSCMMTLATMFNMFIIILTLTIYQQYCCTVDDETALNFAAHFGYLVPLQGTVLFLVVMLITGAMTISIITQPWGASNAENNRFFAILTALSAGVFLLILYFIYEIPSWNQNKNYLEIMSNRVLDVKQVGELRLPSVHDLVKSSVGNRAKVEHICKILEEQGCGDSTDLLHYMQSYSSEPDAVRVGPFARTLEPLGIKPFDALRIAEHIGIVALTHHQRDNARHVPGLVNATAVHS
eukprot:m.10865 g.10865  ORF g.10865 m.10865 type:complete len:359 (-) comp2786_c0_seq1:175-1251(-)